MKRLQERIACAKNDGVRTVGEILQEVGRLYPHAAEIIEQDLANKDMSLEKCFAALYAHAKKNAKGGGWSCGGLSISPDNEAVKVILDFYKITLDAPAAETQALPEPQRGEHASNRQNAQALGHGGGSWQVDGHGGGGASNVIDLLDLL